MKSSKSPHHSLGTTYLWHHIFLFEKFRIDFPDSIHTALNVYNSLGNKIFPDVGFVGKDFTLYDYLLKEYNIESQQEKDWIFQLLLHMESNDIAESQRKIKSEYDKIKKK